MIFQSLSDFIMCHMWMLMVFLLSTNVEGAQNMDFMQDFISDLIKTWKLLSPTLIIEEHMLDFCVGQDMVLCLIKDLETISEMAEHLEVVYQGRKQDGLIFLGVQYSEYIIKQIVHVAPAIFTSKCPVFMPIEFSNMIKLRLDSNIIFYDEVTPQRYELVDKFAVKGGPLMDLKIGEWDMGRGIILKNSMNRWERRTDLKGFTIKNGVIALELKKDENGKIIGSEGYFQDKLFYMTDRGPFTYDIATFLGFRRLPFH